MYQDAYMGQFVKEYKPNNFSVHRLANELFGPVENMAFSPSAVIVQVKTFPDISFYQADIDWNVMGTKTDAVIIRAGQNLYVDEKFYRNWAEAKSRNILRGVYWFYDDRIDPGRQANLLKSLLSPDMPEMEIWCDWENSYNGAFGSLPNVVAFMQAIEAAFPTAKVGLYTGYYWFREHSNSITHASQYNYLKTRPLWLAWYTTDASIVKIPAPWTDLLLWQYGTPAVGAEYGVKTAEIDMNWYNGTDFYQRYGSGTTPPPVQEGKMQIGIVKVSALNYRTGPGVEFPIIGQLHLGDSVVGTINTEKNWFVINHIIVNGIKNIPPSQAYCSASSGYYSSITEYVPPVTGNTPFLLNVEGFEEYHGELKPKA